MNKGLKSYIKDLDITTEFLHKDEFEKKYDVNNAKYPSAYLQNGSSMTIFISVDEMNKVKSLDEMKVLVSKKLEAIS